MSTDRALGFGCVGLIPRAAIVDELDRQGVVDPDDRIHIRRCLRQADAVYVRYLHKVTATLGAGQGSKGSPFGEFANPPINAPKLDSTIFDALFGGSASAKQQAKAASSRAARRRGQPPAKGGTS